MLSFKDRRLGIAEDHGRYDLPFHKDQGTDFLMLLVALMTFLAVMALAAAFVLGGLSDRWSSGLENSLSIEISAENGKGDIRSAPDMDALKDKIGSLLKKNPNVAHYKILTKEDTNKLLEPWLGENSLLDTLPLPGLISVELKETAPEILKSLGADLKAIDPDIALDTHQAWLEGILRLTGSLRWATFFIAGIITLTTVAAVSGAVRARMAIHRADVELLHLMGADDDYIMRQFQRHTLVLSLKGAAAGALCACLVFFLIHLASSGDTEVLLPQLSIGLIHGIMLLATPLAVCVIAGLTARFTVLRALSQMP